MNRSDRRAAERTQRRSSKKAAALGSAAVLASAGAGAAVVLSSAPAGANATIVVDSLTDDGTGLTLREAIDQANTDAGQDEITFSVTGTITLTSDLPKIEEALHIHGPGAADLTIDGDENYRVFLFYAVDGADGSNEVTGLTITGGNALNNPDGGSGGAIGFYAGDADALIEDVVLTGNYAQNDGSAIWAHNMTAGSITINRATVTDNTAGESSPLYISGDNGFVGVTISNSTISGNDSPTSGPGGVYMDYYGTLDIINTVISDNTCGGSGGAVGSEAVTTITNSTITGNSAGYAGGLYFDADGYPSVTFTVVNSTIADNTVLYGGGGVKQFGGSFVMFNSTVSGNSAGSGYKGGGLYLYSAAATIVQSTISGNSAGDGGGIYLGSYAGAAILLSTIADNTATDAGPLVVDGIEVAGGAPIVLGGRHGHAHSAGDDDPRSDGGERRARAAVDPIPAGAVTLIGDIVAGNGDLDLGSGSSESVDVQSLGSVIGATQPVVVTIADAGGTQTGVTAAALKLGPLADNGGPTKTHALLPGSVAIDAGPATADLPTFPGEEYDQRGAPYTRIVNGKVDVGAYEVQPEPTPEPTFTG